MTGVSFDRQISDPPTAITRRKQAPGRVKLSGTETALRTGMDKVWSTQQDTIFAVVVDGSGHLVVRARAGTGKTTTIVEAVKRYLTAHPGKRVVVCAFNKKIADELTLRFAGYTGIEVKTLHAIGFAAVRRYWPGIRVNDKKTDKITRAAYLTDRACGLRCPDAVKALVSKLHTLGREITPYAVHGDDLMDLAVQFECEPDEEWRNEGFSLDYVTAAAARAMQVAADEKPVLTGIDFADMIFLPVRLRLLRRWADLVVVDEAQDMNAAQLIIARGICKGRLVVVGDDRQAIYGFRGADSRSLDRLKDELQARELGLTVTYRCGRAIVDLAAAIVPDFTAGSANPEGTVGWIPEEKLTDVAEPGDFVLSRTNAPLVATAMALLRSGTRAQVAGKDLGAGLTALFTKITKSARSVPEFLERLTGWQDRETKRASKRPGADAKIDAIIDQAETLRTLADGARNLHEIEDRIDALFTDNGLGAAGIVTCSSVHRSKGLEAERVFILAETLRDSADIEELNIRYVAITRAKRELVWVGGVSPAAQAAA